MHQTGPWQAIAAYLYLLHLDDAGLAWEYLRRNLDYQADWLNGAGTRAAARWGLKAFEDPNKDAREAQPLWLRDRTALRLISTDAFELGCTSIFSLWSLPGRKRLIHDGRWLRLTSSSAGGTIRLDFLRTLQEGCRFGYLLPAGAAARADRGAGIGRIDLLERPAVRARAQPARREPLVHMRSLAAMDAKSAGASHREIAVILFGRERVAVSWSPDSELRAQIRHLLARGRKFVDGGHRLLIDPNRRPMRGDLRGGA